MRWTMHHLDTIIIDPSTPTRRRQLLSAFVGRCLLIAFLLLQNSSNKLSSLQYLAEGVAPAMPAYTSYNYLSTVEDFGISRYWQWYKAKASRATPPLFVTTRGPVVVVVPEQEYQSTTTNSNNVPSNTYVYNISTSGVIRISITHHKIVLVEVNDICILPMVICLYWHHWVSTCLDRIDLVRQHFMDRLLVWVVEIWYAVCLVHCYW